MQAVHAFSGGAELDKVRSIDLGLIHNSLIATYHSGRKLVLQRLNQTVFPNLSIVMNNTVAITEFAARQLAAEPVDESRRRFLSLQASNDGEFLWQGDGGFWRAFHFIDGAETLTTLNAHSVGLAGQAFGGFHRLLATYDGPALAETIVDFHHTPRRLEALEGVSRRDPVGRCSRCHEELAELLDNRPLAGALLELQRSGELPTRVVHNDAKLDNVLFDRDTGEILCVVDLDTVMPGLLAFDFGDMVRTMASGCSEDEEDLDRVAVRDDLFQALARGYLSSTHHVLSSGERRSLVLGAQVITLEQAARFLTDYLAGDVYYRCQHKAHNLQRARTQLRLLRSLLAHQNHLEGILSSEF